MSWCFADTELPFGKMKRVLEIDSGNGHMTWGMYLMPLNRGLKRPRDGKCYVYFTTTKKGTFQKHSLPLGVSQSIRQGGGGLHAKGGGHPGGDENFLQVEAGSSCRDGREEPAERPGRISNVQRAPDSSAQPQRIHMQDPLLRNEPGVERSRPLGL